MNKIKLDICDIASYNDSAIKKSATAMAAYFEDVIENTLRHTGSNITDIADANVAG